MTARATTSLLINPPKNSHIALFYDDRIDLERTVADYINIGLARRQLCVYATIRHRDEQHLERIYRLITDYAENIEKGNLLVVDLASYYLSALLGEMKPFDEQKSSLRKRQAREQTITSGSLATQLDFSSRIATLTSVPWWSSGGRKSRLKALIFALI